VSAVTFEEVFKFVAFFVVVVGIRKRGDEGKRVIHTLAHVWAAYFATVLRPVWVDPAA
jgi:hypothetical protein